MSVTEFENKRWDSFTQQVEFRHTSAVELIEHGSVLDFACGDGLLLEMLKQKGIEATGLEISENARDACIQKGLSVELLPLDTPWPFPDNSFDYVVLLDVLEHVYNPTPILAEAKRVSKEYIIVSVPNFSSFPARVQTMWGRVPENNHPHKGHIYWFNYVQLKKIFQENNLPIVALRMNTFSFFRLFGTFFTTLAPNFFALSFVAKIKK